MPFTARLQAAHDGGTDHAAMAGDVDFWWVVTHRERSAAIQLIKRPLKVKVQVAFRGNSLPCDVKGVGGYVYFVIPRHGAIGHMRLRELP